MPKPIDLPLLTQIGPVTVAAAAISSLTDLTDKRGRERQAALSLLRLTLDRDTLTIIHTPDGAPAIADSAGVIVPDLNLSVSHSADIVAIAVAHDINIGIDVEHPSEKPRRVYSKFISENDNLRDMSDQSLLETWTIKEAIYKAALTPGLPLHSIVIADPTCAIASDRHFAIHTMALPSGALITLATRL